MALMCRGPPPAYVVIALDIIRCGDKAVQDHSKLAKVVAEVHNRVEEGLVSVVFARVAYSEEVAIPQPIALL